MRRHIPRPETFAFSGLPFSVLALQIFPFLFAVHVARPVVRPAFWLPSFRPLRRNTVMTRGAGVETAVPASSRSV